MRPRLGALHPGESGSGAPDLGGGAHVVLGGIAGL